MKAKEAVESIVNAGSSGVEEGLSSGIKGFFITIAKYAGVSLIVFAGGIFLVKNFTHFFDVPVVTVKTVTEKEIIDNTNLTTTNQISRAILKAIDKARNGETKPLVQLPETATKKEIQTEVNKLQGEVALAEPSKQQGVNIYSIKIHKQKHALGFYVGGNLEESSKEKTSYGIHYRNDRVAYELGKTFSGKMECRVIWEAMQW